MEFFWEKFHGNNDSVYGYRVNRRFHKAGFVLILSLAFIAVEIFAQVPRFSEQRPSDERPELPEFITPAEPVLPLPPVPEQQTRQAPLSTQVKIAVSQIKLVGNTVFSDEELAEVTASYTGRVVTSDELQQLRHQLTLYYVERGYINSGAIIPDQQVKDGVVTLQIIEGHLTEIAFSGNERLRNRYLESILAQDFTAPLNIQNLQDRLQLLQQDPLIDQINANLTPGVKPGEAMLSATIKEALPYQFGITLANDRSPSVGGERARLFATHRNVSGWGDSIGLRFGITDGADDFTAFYSLPFTDPYTKRRTVLDLSYEVDDSVVIEEPFDDLDIDSELKSYSVSLTHTVFRTPRQYFTLGLSLTRIFHKRMSETNHNSL